MRFDFESENMARRLRLPSVAGLLSVLLALFVVHPARSAAHAEDNPQGMYFGDTNAGANFIAFVTGKLGVKNALVQIRLGRSAPARLFTFSYQSNMFFGREYCASKHRLDEFCMSDTMCGKCKDAFWYYNANPAAPLLYTGKLAQDAPETEAYFRSVGSLDIFAGWFQSFGISDQGLNTVRYTNNTLSVLYRKKHPQNVATLIFHDGLPRAATRTFRDNHGHSSSQRFVYSYDTNICPPGIPSACVEEKSGMQIKILRLELLVPPAALAKSDCFPASVFGNTNIGRVVHSNKIDYFVLKDKRLSSMAGPIPDKEIAQIKAGRRFFYIGAICVGALALLPLWSQHRRRKQQHKSKQ